MFLLFNQKMYSRVQYIYNLFSSLTYVKPIIPSYPLTRNAEENNLINKGIFREDISISFSNAYIFFLVHLSKCE